MPRTRKPEAAVPMPAVAVTPAPVAEQETGTGLDAATGTHHRALQAALLRDVVAVLGLRPGTEAFEQRGAAALGLMASFAPRDGVEGMLAGQAAALNAAGMQALRRAVNPDLPPEIASRLQRAAANLLRAAAEMVAAIHSHRGGAVTQVVRVERVVVQEGGQAVVGAVAGGGRGRRE
jgi:hypothetical protein